MNNRISETIISIQNVTKSYRKGVPVLNGVSLEITRGEFITIIGPSGCGKTTLLRMINGMVSYDSGNIVVMQKEMALWDMVQLRRSIGYVIQQGALFPHLTIRQNIEFVLSISAMVKDLREERIHALSNMMGLNKLQLDAFPSELSGGQQQRIGLARALAGHPEIVLMDEPLGALDNITRGRLQNELKEMHKTLGITFVVVTHDLQEAFKLGDRVIIMNEGNLIQMDTPDKILKSPVNEWVREFTNQFGQFSGEKK